MRATHRAAAVIGTVWYQAKMDAARSKPRAGWTVGEAIEAAYGSPAHRHVLALIDAAYERGKTARAKR